MRKILKKHITLIVAILLLSMNGYAEEIDTIAIINAMESDTLNELVHEYYYHTMRRVPSSAPISTSYNFSGISYEHYQIPFMTPEMVTGDSSILIIVDDATYHHIPSYILRYASDVYYGTNFDVYVESVQNASHTQVKNLILTYQNGLKGVVLIGNIADAKFEQTYFWEYDSWPCDLYFMDLDGVWTDAKDAGGHGIPNGIYEKHEGNVKPEVFVSRISTMGAHMYNVNKDSLLIRYFNKDHDYWMGKRIMSNHRALSYVNKDWKLWWDKLYGVKHVFGEEHYDMIRHGDAGFGKPQYELLVQERIYDIVELCAHSNYNIHAFTDNAGTKSYLYSSEIYHLSTTPIGMSLFSCVACNWLMADSAETIDVCDAYIYNSGNTLFVVGSTKSGGMNNTKNFFKPLGQGLSVGEAFKQWFVKTLGNNHNEYDVSWFYGMCIIGDPLISMTYDATEFCPDTLLLTAIPKDTLSEVTYKAAHKIIVQENFQIPNNMHVIFDAPEIDFAPNFTCISGGTFETRGNGCVCSRGVSNTPNHVSAKKKQSDNIDDNHNVAFSVIPNPVNDILSINSLDVLEQIEIYNINGQHAIRTNQLEINVSGLPQGIYLLRAVTTDGQMRQAKFIKQ
ncbi:MAG: T9SS type A sorting domain-containing protein [Paludibacteraceae bacterium]|nr:T9SS type A sorting domain-containing protein [Paludibacteraceae bacterium]